jgi:hypothetical protein
MGSRTLAVLTTLVLSGPLHAADEISNPADAQLFLDSGIPGHPLGPAA